jgi:hypothetical protein
MRASLLQPSVREPSLPVVTPGDAQASFLFRKVTGDFTGLACAPRQCGDRMPPRSAPLPPEDIRSLRAWIEAGAP